MKLTLSRSRLRSVATTVAVALTLALAAAAGCDNQQEPKLPSVRDKIRESHIYGQPKLRIGVSATSPLMSQRNADGTFSGFDIEIARYIATSLGYEGDQRIDFVTLTTEQRVEALQAGTVDLVVTSFSMTEEREKLVSFAGPYLVTTPEVLVPVALKDKIRTLEDLADPAYKVCASGGSTTETELRQHDVPVRVVQEVEDCVKGMLEGRYDAAASDETMLAGFRYLYPDDFEIVNMPFGTSELIGVGVPIGDPALRDLVAFFLQKSYRQGRETGNSPWQSAYNRTLGGWLGVPRTQPQPLDVPELVDFDDRAPQR
ncbi:glutamate-binding protein [Micromonospora yangpuensis]|uniref:Amino acid ABC transporter substrate-binding protein, PAAT family n=1 Tax=Micromonospora yangpuensis TaxID=683228 RepID=A0A1C6VFU9_9ACTN|nr:glutamate-binding protein [Micromonospora yangpuensis]SCL65057.1 amino acid ABC transporter substrate-binding protein, PAAT family [Micromonospora yangpuensis]